MANKTDEKLLALETQLINEFEQRGFSFYTEFLAFTGQGNLHRFSVKNQMIIFAQNPKASIVVPYKTWENVGRHPKRRSGIKVFPSDWWVNKENYVFDIKDTYGQTFSGAWSFEDADLKDYVLQKIAPYGNSLDTAIENLTRTYVCDILKERNENCNELTDEKTVNFIIECSNYVVLTRTGEHYSLSQEAKETFEKVKDYQNFILSIQPFIQQTAHAILKAFGIYAQERGKEYAERFRKTDTRGRSEIERHVGRRDPGASGMRESGGNDRRGYSGALKSDGQGDPGLSERKRSTESRTATGVESVDSVNRAETRGSKGNEATTGKGILGAEQTGESGRFSGSGTSAESRSKSSNGDSAERSDVSSYYIEENDGQLSLFELSDNNEDSISDDVKYDYIHPKLEKIVPQEFIKYTLLRGSGFVDGKKRIYEIYQTIDDAAEREKLIKKEYGTGGAGWPIDGYGLHGYDTFHGKGLHFSWRDEAGEKEGYINWKRVEAEIGKLIQSGEYYRETQERVLLEDTADAENEIIVQDVQEEQEHSVSTGFSAKTKFRQNIEAIQTLQLVENENRPASAKERQILSKYVGWGGLSNAFNQNDKNWKKEYQELLELLSPEEYKAARASVNDAFYTPESLIKNIYNALEQFGFQGGKVLEPSMGIGKFISYMPMEMRESSQIYGVELDNISGRIAKVLHPNANIQITGFENAKLERNTFDVVVGNIPFGDYRVSDPDFSSHKFLIHDYFIAKSLEYVRPGGILCLITGKGTLDKANAKARKYIDERAELLGAIRLPSATFKAEANTEVTSDILFLQKRSSPCVKEAAWTGLGLTEDGIPVNAYYIDHPQMMLGKMERNESMFGKNSTYTQCKAFEGMVLEDALKDACGHLPHNVFYPVVQAPEMEIVQDNMNAVDYVGQVKNHTYVVLDNKLYYRENDELSEVKESEKTIERIKGMCNIRLALRKLIDIQRCGCTEEELSSAQVVLNDYYDDFVRKYGFISSRENGRAMEADVDYPLLYSLEDINENEVTKAPIFYRQTIRPDIRLDNVDSAIEALNIALNEYGYVNIERILELYPVSFEEMVQELEGEIFLNPEKMDKENSYVGWESAEEYLSGYVRHKLQVAEDASAKDERFQINVNYLKEVQPRDLEASEIDVRLGTNWISTEDYEEFLIDFLEIPLYMTRKFPHYGNSKRIFLEHDNISNEYFIQSKSLAKGIVKNKSTYGTSRMPALEIIENLLNLRDIVVRDRIDLDDGKYKYVVNQHETMLAKEKAELIKEEFKNWIFEDTKRREKYVEYYNNTFNNIQVRKYNGENLTFPGMSLEYELKTSQKNAVARIIRGGNTLLAHCVGAGKSFIMTAACMELKRLGLAHKPMIVVPNHLTGQMAAEFLKLYPSANVLLTTKKDFAKDKRKQFISKIATGDYDAVVIGHSQFEKIPISAERQEQFIQREIDDVLNALEYSKKENGNSWTVKQLERKRKSLVSKMEELKRDGYKDDVITFEELGVDALFVDEAHEYKNLSFTTKMNRVAGINPDGAKKSMDLYLKIQYIQELTPEKNVVFATGTPVSNSMCELYIMQKYLQQERLKEMGILNFDAWAANFGQTVDALELAPEGTGYRMKTRFAKFVNVPELINLYRMFADVQLSSMLNLNVPKLKDGKYQIIESQPNEVVKSYMDSFVERAERIRSGAIDPSDDNMLKICHDARLLSTDARLLDEDALNDPDSKLNCCVRETLRIYKESEEFKGTQIIFCDIGTPNGGQSFNVYDYLKSELVKSGILEAEICYIHDAKTDKQRDDMFANLRAGKQRIIIGSTAKMGTGTNIQKRLIAMHEIDVPWRPSDVEQREGRIIRQGNMNKEVSILRYITKGTFDAFNWSIIENKQKFISQIMTDQELSRTCEDIDESVMNYAEMKAVASGNPLIKEKMQVDMEVSRLKVLKNSFLQQHYQLDNDIHKKYPAELSKYQSMLQAIEADIQSRDTFEREHGLLDGESFQVVIEGKTYDKREDAGEAFFEACANLMLDETRMVGFYDGFEIGMHKAQILGDYEKEIVLKGERTYCTSISSDAVGCMVKLKNIVKSFEKRKAELEQKIALLNSNLAQAKADFNKTFPEEEALMEYMARQKELDMLLTVDTKDSELIVERQEDEPLKKRTLRR